MVTFSVFSIGCVCFVVSYRRFSFLFPFSLVVSYGGCLFSLVVFHSYC